MSPSCRYRHFVVIPASAGTWASTDQVVELIRGIPAYAGKSTTIRTCITLQIKRGKPDATQATARRGGLQRSGNGPRVRSQHPRAPSCGIFYHSWRIGAGYSTEEVTGLVARAGSGCRTTRSGSLALTATAAPGSPGAVGGLIGAWADEQAAARKALPAPEPDTRRARLLGEIEALRREPGASGRLLDV